MPRTAFHVTIIGPFFRPPHNIERCWMMMLLEASSPFRNAVVSREAVEEEQAKSQRSLGREVKKYTNGPAVEKGMKSPAAQFRKGPFAAGSGMVPIPSGAFCPSRCVVNKNKSGERGG
jgi:hypothetical protein